MSKTLEELGRRMAEQVERTIIGQVTEWTYREGPVLTEPWTETLRRLEERWPTADEPTVVEGKQCT